MRSSLLPQVLVRNDKLLQTFLLHQVAIFMQGTADNLFQSIAQMEEDYQASLPPVHLWNPELSGDLDMRIDREGRWFYQGGEIHRAAMVKMFSRILKREGDDFFLVTPVEKWRIQVDVAPFLMTDFTIVKDDDAYSEGILLTTNVGNEVLLNQDHPLWVDTAEDGSPLPMVMVRDGLPGLLSRSVYYRLVEHAREQDGHFYVISVGERFLLG